MNNLSITNQDNFIITSKISYIERSFKFYFLLILHIPSLCSTLLILYHFQWKRLVSQIFGLLLLINALLILAELPFTLTFLYDGYVRNRNICSSWVLVNYILFILSIILIAWTSIERYLFIFHEHLINHYQILLHYFPIGFFIVYTPLFYIGLVIFYPCEQAYDIFSYLCAGPCYLFQIVPCLIDWSINVAFVLSITCTRRTVRLSLQLFSISIPCIIGWAPYGIVSTMQIFKNTEFLSYLLTTYLIYFPYLETIFLPYACLFFIPEMKKKFFKFLMSSWVFKKICRHNRIHISHDGTNINTLAHGHTMSHYPIPNK